MAKPRQLWRFLKPATKRRYRQAGIHPNTYNAGKVSVQQRKAARGHAHTPERPRQAELHPEQFVEYLSRRQPEPERQVISEPRYEYSGEHAQEVVDALQARIAEIFSDRPKYREPADPNWVPVGQPPAPPDEEIMAMIQADPMEIENTARAAAMGAAPQWWILWYH